MPRSRTSLPDALAWLLSALCSPFVVFAWLIVLFVRHTAATTDHFFYWSLLTLIVTTSIPAIFILWQVRRGRIGDAHIARREDRLSVFAVFLVSLAVGALLLWRLDAPRLFRILSLLILANAIPAGLITTQWKISMHSWVIAAALTVYALSFGTPTWFWWLALLVPAVVWARVTRGRHTLWQGVGGALAGVLVTSLFYVFIRQ